MRAPHELWPVHDGGDASDAEDVAEIKSWPSGATVRRIVTCAHSRRVPVITGGERVADLCLTCDEQLLPRPKEDA